MTDRNPQDRGHDATPQPNNVIIQQLMTIDTVTCSPTDSLERAAQLMWERDIGAVPVLDRDRRVVGMITDRDIAMASYLHGTPLDEIQVQTAMARDIESLHPQDSPHQAASVMRQRQIHRLPIVDREGVLRGVLTLNDLVQRGGSNGHGPLSLEEVSETLHSIGAPRQPESPVGSL